MLFGISIKTIVLGLLAIAVLGTGAWFMNEHNKIKDLQKDKLESDAAIAAYRKQEKQAIYITEVKKAYVKKATKVKEAVNEETNKPEYSIAIPIAGRLLINNAIEEANSYISSTDQVPTN